MKAALTAVAIGSRRELQQTLAELERAIDRHEELGWTRSDPPVQALLERLEATRNIMLEHRGRRGGDTQTVQGALQST